MTDEIFLYEVDGKAFAELRAGRKLRSLVDVLAGDKPPDKAGFEAGTVFRSQGFDRTFVNIEHLLRSVMPVDNRYFDNFYVYYATQIKHKTHTAFYYEPQQLLWVLMTHRAFTFAVLAEEKRSADIPLVQDKPYAYTSRGNTEYAQVNIVAHEGLAQSVEIIRDWAAAKVSPGSGSGDLDHIFSTYANVIRFMTSCIYRGDDRQAVYHAAVLVVPG